MLPPGRWGVGPSLLPNGGLPLTPTQCHGWATSRSTGLRLRDVMAVLMPIWNDKRETARRVRLRLSAIFKWSVAQGYRDDNPAGDAIGAALPKNGVHREQHRGIGPQRRCRGLATIREAGAWAPTKLALRFLVLTACVPGKFAGPSGARLTLKVRRGRCQQNA